MPRHAASEREKQKNNPPPPKKNETKQERRQQRQRQRRRPKWHWRAPTGHGHGRGLVYLRGHHFDMIRAARAVVNKSAVDTQCQVRSGSLVRVMRYILTSHRLGRCPNWTHRHTSRSLATLSILRFFFFFFFFCCPSSKTSSVHINNSSCPLNPVILGKTRWNPLKTSKTQQNLVKPSKTR